MLNNLERGDEVVVRGQDGQTHKVTVLSVKPDYEHPGGFVRFDYIDNNEASPMRRTAWPKDLIQILKKNTTPKLDPKSPRPGDSVPAPQNAIILNGKTYVERTSGDPGTIPLNPDVEAPAAVAQGPKPVTERIKKSKTTA